MANTKKSKPRSLKKEDVFIFSLFAFLLLDIGIHFTHPAYRYYRQLSHLINDRQDRFERKVENDFIPAITLVASNGIVRSSSSSPSPAAVVSALPVPPASSISIQEREKVTSVVLPRSSSFYVVNGDQYVNILGFNYSLGDIFDGSPIVSMSPLGFSTSRAFYTFPLDLSRASSAVPLTSQKDIVQ